MKHPNLIDYDHHLGMIDKKRAGKLPEGLGIGITDWDNYIRLKPNDFTVVFGHANVGKTTVILWTMLVYSVKHGTRWLIYSSENNAWSLIDKLISMKLMEQTPKVTDQDYYNARDFVMHHFQFIDDTRTYTAYELLRVAQDMITDYPYDGFLIDPYNSLMKDREILRAVGAHEYDYEVATAFRLFCKKEGKSLFLNAHGVTEALRKAHGKNDEYLGQPLEGHPRPLAVGDIEGGSKWSSRSDNMWCIHRYTRHENLYNYSLIHVNKVKETETGGAPTFFNEPVRLQMYAGNCFKVGGLYNPISDETPETQQAREDNTDIFGL